MKNKGILLIIIILVIIVFLAIFKNSILKIFYPIKYEEIVTACASEFNVDKNLIYAVIKAESNFDENAISNKGALGLMQVMEETAKDVAGKINLEIDEENPKDDILKADNNIKIGTKYLSILMEKYQNTELALAAYNAGIGNVDNWMEKGILNEDGSNIEDIPYKETNNYVRIILQNYKIYNELWK